MGSLSLLFAKGFPSSKQPKLPSCFSADCHWKLAVFLTLNVAGLTADLTLCPIHMTSCQGIHLSFSQPAMGATLLPYPYLQNLWAEVNLTVDGGFLHTGQSRLPLQLCWADQSPVTYTPAGVTHLPEKVLCSPKQSCLENDEGAYQMLAVGPASHGAGSRRPPPLTSSPKSSVELPLQACRFHFHLNMMLDIR